MRVYLGSDHAGFELKASLIEHLKSIGHDPVDCGALAYDPDDDYPQPCITAASMTVADAGSLGVVIGGSGNGEQIAANKVAGVRAALCNDLYTARLSREHNDANVLSMGGRIVAFGLADEILALWLSTAFEGGRHQRRIDQISAAERSRPVSQ